MRLVGQGFVLMQDNDTKHTSKLCQRYIKGRKLSTDVFADSISGLKIPLNWCGMNLTEKIRAKQLTTADHLGQLLQESFEELSSGYFQSLVERMLWICKKMLAAKGVNFDESEVLEVFCVFLGVFFLLNLYTGRLVFSMIVMFNLFFLNITF